VLYSPGVFPDVHPMMNVESIDRMIGLGLEKVRDVILLHAEHVLGQEESDGSSLSASGSTSDSSIEVDPLQAVHLWRPTLPIINWNKVKGALITGIWNTDYMHYKVWHEGLLKCKAKGDGDHGDAKRSHSTPGGSGTVSFFS
jgi:hypothetical protein